MYNIMFTRVFLTLISTAYVFAGENGLRSIYETVQIIQSEGYVGESHHLLTDDGYMLEMHRIPYKHNETSGAPDRPVIFLMHGLMAASNSYLVLGPEYAIAYNLADAGFDVWMGNARGNRLSRKHTNLDPDDREDRLRFFDFTWEEIGYYDVANMIDYILAHTNNTKLNYVGHSQGGTAFLVLTTMKPEYNDKILSAHLLAGVGHKEHFPNVVLRTLAMFSNTIWALAQRIGIVELFPPIGNRNSTVSSDFTFGEYEYEYDIEGGNFDSDCGMDKFCRPQDYCTGNVNQKEMCALFGVEEVLPANLLNSGVELGLSLLGGASLKQFAHYGQNIQDKTFRRWDYGSVQNLLRYGTREPPIYNISLITVPTTMHYTINDNLLDERDVHYMCDLMPNCVARRIARESFEHADFVVATDVKELMTDYMIARLLEAHNYYLESYQVPPQVPPVPEPLPGGSPNINPGMVTALFLIITIVLL